MENTIPWIISGEVLQQYFRVLADSSVRVKKYQQAFLALLPETVAIVVFEPSCSCVFSFTFLLFLSLFHGHPFYPPTLCSLWRFLRATIVIQANYSFWLWTLPWLHSQGPRTTLLRIWARKSLPSPTRVRANVILLVHYRHGTRNTSVEVISFLPCWESETMVHP